MRVWLREFAAGEDEQRGNQDFDVEVSGLVVNEDFDLVLAVVDESVELPQV